MAWAEITNPSQIVGATARTGMIGLADVQSIFHSVTGINLMLKEPLASWNSLQDGILGVPISATEPSGSLQFTGGGGGGGGGSTRPSSGFLYPRGQS